MADIVIEDTADYQRVRTLSAAGHVDRIVWKPGRDPDQQPAVLNEATLNAEIAADLAGLRLIIDSTGTLTLAQLSNAARLLARCVLKLGRLVLRKLDATN